MVLSQEQRQGGGFRAVYSIPPTSPGWSQQEKSHGWKRKQCHLLPGQGVCQAGIRIAQLLSTGTELLLQLLELLSHDCCHYHREREPSCHLHSPREPALVLPPPLELALWQHNSLFRQTFFPGFGFSLSSLISGPGGGDWAMGASRSAAFVFLSGLGSHIRMVIILPVFRDCSKYCPRGPSAVSALLWVELSLCPVYPILLILFWLLQFSSKP